MIKVNWDEKMEMVAWTPDEVQAYYTQQMAFLMERQVLALEKQAETQQNLTRTISKFWEMADNQRGTYQLALELMTNRQTVILALDGRGTVPLSQFRQRLYSQGIRAYGDRLQEAIGLTDYLVLEPAGNGYRVWRAEDYAAARERT